MSLEQNRRGKLSIMLSVTKPRVLERGGLLGKETEEKIMVQFCFFASKT
jgi:hypothetical protein